ncbi:alaserpin-like [Zophobas morio]|uniref:alaserpin-like n=1 Tax=Zophobas morio TaxID=2755281 RepID=UPI00308397ED
MMLFLLAFVLCVASAEDSHVSLNANNLFTPTVYKEIAKSETGNFLVSPFSAKIILSLAQSGCKNETAKEIRQALYLPDDNSKIQSQVKNVLSALTKNEYALHAANKIYVKENFAINDEFKQEAVEVYQSEIESLDFCKKEEAATAMNQWVEEKTQNKIQNLINPDILDNKTRAVLINALYFQGNWSITFPPMLTAKANFYKSENEVVEVDTMNLEDEELLYYECPYLNAKLLELPFKGEGASMTIVLPNEKHGLASLESNIKWVFTPHNLTLETVSVALPKFKIESQLDLKAVLQNLGVAKVFDEEQADLSGIAGEKGDLIISAVVQKTFVEVDEKGVEAAAATYIPVIVPDMGVVDPKTFIADHPFIFYIKVKGVILFAGRVVLPTL